MPPPSNIDRYLPGSESSVKVHRALAITSAAFAAFIGALIVVLLVAYRRQRRHLVNQPELAEVCCSHGTRTPKIGMSCGIADSRLVHLSKLYLSKTPAQLGWFSLQRLHVRHGAEIWIS